MTRQAVIRRRLSWLLPRRRLLLALCCAALPGLSAQAQTAVDCEQAGRAAERTFALPPGLLLAVGRVESGRWDHTARRLIPWAWSVNVDGSSRIFDSATDAVRETRVLQAAGPHDIDVGCFQISLLYHPAAFADLHEAFDPAANANYAARFLVSLKNRFGSWPAAVAMYHSADPGLGIPYRERVFATWPGTAVPEAPAGPEFAMFPGVHLWGPSPRGTAGMVIAIGAPVSAALPRVITPSR
jgi:hypothetical protein